MVVGIYIYFVREFKRVGVGECKWECFGEWLLFLLFRYYKWVRCWKGRVCGWGNFGWEKMKIQVFDCNGIFYKVGVWLRCPKRLNL